MTSVQGVDEVLLERSEELAALSSDLDAVLKTARGRLVLRARGVRDLRRGPRPSTRQNPRGLTAREIEVLGPVAAGQTNRQIAYTLFISEKTASVHVTNILRKLGVTSRGEASAKALRLRLPGPKSVQLVA